MNIELHMHRSFLNTREQLVNLDRLLEQLHDAHLHLTHTDGWGCGRPADCIPEVEELGLNCRSDCASYLFARRPLLG
jgi:hypothetical protein